jgi:preprotein translocase subunit YajC
MAFQHLLSLLQDSASSPDSGGGQIMTLLVMMGVVIAVMYFVSVRPERARQMSRATMLGGIKKNDKVITWGGIRGKVVNVNEKERDLTVLIDEKNQTKVRVVLDYIAAVEQEEGGQDTKPAEKTG